MDMYKWLKNIKESRIKKALPILSSPSIQLLNVGMNDFISDSSLQAQGMKKIADRTDACACVSMMDLSVEAEAFGSQIRIEEGEIPTVSGHIIDSLDDAMALKIPEVGAGRTGLYIEAIKKACNLIMDRPVFAGVIGPFSLAGRLLDVSETMIYCFMEPRIVDIILQKVIDFLIGYIRAYKKAGANGVIIAEPLAGLIPPDFVEKFSSNYISRVVNELQDNNFIIIYHNCGSNTILALDSILKGNCAAYHFGNAIDMGSMMQHMPNEFIAMGNIDPARQFRNGTPASIREKTLNLLSDCSKYPNFLISSGCDIPPLTPWANIDAFFDAIREFYER